MICPNDYRLIVVSKDLTFKTENDDEMQNEKWNAKRWCSNYLIFLHTCSEQLLLKENEIYNG